MKTTSITWIIIAAFFASGILSCVLSFNLGSVEWQNLLMSISVALFQLALGTALVTYYLVYVEKKKTKEATYEVISGDIGKFFIEYIKCLSTQFTANECLNIKDKVLQKRDSNEIDSQTIKRYIDAIKDDYNVLINDMELCLQQIGSVVPTGIANNGDFLMLYLGANRFFYALKIRDIEKEEDHIKILSNLDAFATTVIELADCYWPEFRQQYLLPWMEEVFSN